MDTENKQKQGPQNREGGKSALAQKIKIMNELEKNQTIFTNNIPEKLGKCSILKNVKDVPTQTTLLDELQGIKSGKWRFEVEAVRQGQKAKDTLPQICAYGVFHESRKDDCLIMRSGFAVLDYDAKDNPMVDFKALKTNLARLPFILAVFTSPSGNGLKAIIRVPSHLSEKAQADLCNSVLKPLGGRLDAGMSAFKHAFVSYDPEMYLNEFSLSEIPPIEDLATMDTRALCSVLSGKLAPLYNYGKSYYDTAVFSERSSEQIRRKLKDDLGIPNDKINSVLTFIDNEKVLHEIKGALSGHMKGLYETKSGKVFVKTSPELLSPKPGFCEDVKKSIYDLFDDPSEPMQVHTFLSLLKNARLRLRQTIDANLGKCDYPVLVSPALCIMGERSVGKTTFVKNVLVPLLGGRFMNGGKVLVQNSRFTGSLEGVEVLVVDDKAEEYTSTARQNFTDKIKEVCFSSTNSGERKGVDESVIVGGCWFIVQLFNPDKIETAPIYESDKIVFFNARKDEKRFDGFSVDDFSELNRRIKSQLEAFAYWIDNEYEAPEEIVPTNSEERRIGVKAYCHPLCKKLLAEADKDLNLLGIIDEAVSAYRLRYGERITASDILRAVDEKRASVVEFALKLKSVEKRFPKRIEQIRSGGQGRGWIIHAPSDASDSTK